MSDSKLQRLVSQVNQIALNMSANGSEEMVADQVAQHLEKFWAPPMKDLITDQPTDTDMGLSPIAQTADMGLSPIAQTAIQNLKLVQEAKRA